MGVSTSFTYADGTTLGSIPGFTLLLGTDDCRVVSNQIARNTGSSAAVFYGTGADGSTSQTVGADLIGGASQVAGIVVFGSVAGGLFSGYILRPQTGFTSMRLLRVVNNVATSILTTGTVTDCVGIELRATVSGGSPSFAIFRGGVAVSGGTFTDTNAAKMVSGQRGIAVVTTSAITPLLDNYWDNQGAAFTIGEPASGFVFEGVRTTSSISIPVSWSGSPSTVDARIVDTSGTPISGFDWTTKIATPSGGAGTITFTGLPASANGYQVQVRDGGNTSTFTNGANTWYVGAVAVIWGRSQAEKLFTVGPGALAPTAGSKVSIMRQGRNSGDPATLYTLSGGAGTMGGGAVAIANQWQADTSNYPLMIVDASFAGQAIETFVNNATVGTPSWALWTGYVTAALAAAKNQASIVLYYMADTGASYGSTSAAYTAYQGYLDSIRTKFETALSGMSLLHGVIPHMRADNGDPGTYALREAMYDKANSGSNWRLAGWVMDLQLDGDGSPHQATGTTGNQRIGYRLGRSLAHLINNLALDVIGPVVTTAKFTDTGRTVIELTFDRNIKRADGTAYSGSPVVLPPRAFSVSTDSGSTFSTPGSGLTAAITAANKVRLTKTSGAWTQSTTTIDYLRGIPFSSEVGDTNDYAGVESAAETNYLSQVVTDTTTFDSSRGMPLAPFMGAGLAIAEPVISTSYGPYVITVTDALGAVVSLTSFNITVNG